MGRDRSGDAIRLERSFAELLPNQGFSVDRDKPEPLTLPALGETESRRFLGEVDTIGEVFSAATKEKPVIDIHLDGGVPVRDD